MMRGLGGEQKHIQVHVISRVTSNECDIQRAWLWRNARNLRMSGARKKNSMGHRPREIPPREPSDLFYAYTL